MWLRRRRQRRRRVMPERFNKLARYNGEVRRGIMHTQEYDAEMAQLQREYNQWNWGTP